jgi:cytochrome P450
MDTVASFLGFVMLLLAQNPAVRRQVASDPAAMPDFVEELFRRYPVVTIGREVVRDMDYRGVQLKKGEMVMCPTALAGLDAGVNERPFEFDLRRPSRIHSSFGEGPHRCPGAALAQLEVRVATQAWLARIPDFSLAPDARIAFVGGVTPAVEELPLIWPV